MTGTAHIIFELNGDEYTYDGAMPEQLDELCAQYLDNNGFWKDRPKVYPTEFADEEDGLPGALWEICRIGGHVVRVVGQRQNGAIHWADWVKPRIY